MAHHKSAIKRIRRNNSAGIRNNQYLTAVRTAVKKFRLAVSSAAAGTIDKATVSPLFHKAQSLLAKAANKGVLHPNNASRKVGRLAALLKTLESGAAAAAVTALAEKNSKKKSVAKKEVAAAAPAKAKEPKETKAKTTKPKSSK